MSLETVSSKLATISACLVELKVEFSLHKLFIKVSLVIIYSLSFVRWSKGLFFRSVICRLNGRPTIGYNVLGLGEVGEIEAQMFNKPLMLIEVQMFNLVLLPPCLPNPC